MADKSTGAGPSLGDLVHRACQDGPQGVRENGREVAFVVSADDDRASRRSNAPDDPVAVFETWPSSEDVDLKRDRDEASQRGY